MKFSVTPAIRDERLNFTRRSSQLLALTIFYLQLELAVNALTALVVNVNIFLALEQREKSWMPKAFVLGRQLGKRIGDDRVIAWMLVVVKSGSRQA